MDPALDHIIILVTPEVLHNLPSALTSAFTITPGGTHADGLTENKLIVFPDGAYLELIAFLPSTSPAARAQHWWGGKDVGIIDFALTSSALPAEGAFPAAYTAPQAGGRIRPDGIEVRWVVTFPSAEMERGTIPFWCHDTTPRDLRVPTDPTMTTHPSGAVGIRGLTVRVPAGQWDAALNAYGAIPGAEVVAASEGDVAATFRIGTVRCPEETVEVKLVKGGDGDRVSFDELVVRVGGEKGTTGRGAVTDIQLGEGLLRIRWI